MGIFTIVLSGNIAAGKSTTGPLLADQLNACYVAEPVEQWRNSGRLKAFYETQNAFDFQSYVLKSRTSALNAALVQWRCNHNGADPGVVVMDRWLADDFMFAEVSLQLGTMTANEFAHYTAQYQELCTTFNKHLCIKTIWIDTPPTLCLSRLQVRGRNEETTVSLEYLCALDARRPRCDYTLQPGTLGAGAIATVLAEYINTHFRPVFYVCPGLLVDRAQTDGKIVITNHPKDDDAEDLKAQMGARSIVWACHPTEFSLQRINMDSSVVFLGSADFAAQMVARNVVGKVVQCVDCSSLELNFV